MSEPWIRVHANLRDKPVVWRAVEALGISQAEAVGLLVGFWGAASQHVTNGAVGEIPDAQIEAWAGWSRKKGKFAAWLRAAHLDRDGRVNEWDEYAGHLEEQRRQARDRKRRSRAGHADNAVTSSPTTTTTTTKRNDVTAMIVVDEEAAVAKTLGVTDPELTALFLAVCANTAVTERWGAQANPFTLASAVSLEQDLRAAAVEPAIARASLYRQCRESGQSRPPRSINYFRPGILAEWEAEQTRRAVAASGESPPSAPSAHEDPLEKWARETEAREQAERERSVSHA